MVKFIDVDPSEVPNFRDSRRGRVSYPILKTFMETGKPLAQLDRTGIPQGIQSLMSSMHTYIKSHRLPLRVFQRRGQIYLMRTDIDDAGNVPVRTIDEFKKIPEDESQYGNAEIPVMSADEVTRRYDSEKSIGN